MTDKAERMPSVHAEPPPRAEIAPARHAAAKFSEVRKNLALAVLSQGKSQQLAADAADISRTTLLEWRAKDKAFDAACRAAMESGVDRLEDELVRRAAEGVDRPIFQGGVLVGHERQYSDNLLIMALKGRRPQTYRENYQGSESGGTINLNVSSVDKDL